MTKVKVYPAEGNGAHIRSVEEMSVEVEAVRNIAETAAGGGIEEAPVDGSPYLREDSGWVSPQGHRTLLLSRSEAPPIVLPIHDGLAGTEITVDFGTVSDASLDINAGIITVLAGIDSMINLLEFHVRRAGGGPNSIFTFWVEYSIDGGTTWITFSDSLRSTSVDKDGDGMVTADLSVDEPITVGFKFRIKATNTGAGTLSIEAPNPLTTSNGMVVGFKTKITSLYIPT
jgi:hypothetical protein